MEPPNTTAIKVVLDQLMTEFFRAVSFEPGEAPPYEIIHGLFIEKGLLIKNTAATPEIFSISQFITPRLAMVQAGEVTGFHEEELSESTHSFGNVAHRFSAYAKSGTMNGVSFTARGMISTQFVSTPEGWRISAMAWDDERPGLSIPDASIPVRL